jgi:hypothetical protein
MGRKSWHGSGGSRDGDGAGGKGVAAKWLLVPLSLGEDGVERRWWEVGGTAR